MARSPSAALSQNLVLASLGTALAIGVICAIGLSSLGNASEVARLTVARQLALADDAAAMSAFMYQKGFVAEYLLTGNRTRLEELETSRPAFESWLARAREKVNSPDERTLLDTIHREYGLVDQVRRRAVALHDAGTLDEAKAQQDQNHERTRRLRDLLTELGSGARGEAERLLEKSERSIRALVRVLVASSIVAAAASLLAGFFWARRVARPIYELQVRVESAAERTRIKVEPGRQGLDALGDQVSALVEKLEDTDAALAEHRCRLIQSEKLSALGELATKLAHEVLNPLAGIKAAMQLLGRRRDVPAPGAQVVEVAEAVNREITRVDSLLRRLMSFARPLAPRVQAVTIGALLDGAVEASRAAMTRGGVTLSRHEEPHLPPIEADPLLVTQALTNLLTNAADAMAGTGGEVSVQAGRAVALGRDEILISVADQGPGIEEKQMGELFKPFFTTKADGHGLGLAVSQNILLEHGGRITARNRPSAEGPGAVFEVALPVLR
jgi:C4-dicarboxylate-specific signal transduction histidine kinase